MAGRKIITHNPDPLNLVIVNCKEGDYLRAKRGTYKKAVINEAFAAQAMETCSVAAREIMTKLKPFTEQMFGRKQVYLSGLLRTARLRSGFTDYSGCDRWEVMKDHPLIKLYYGQCKVRKEKNTVHLEVPFGEDYFNLENKTATHYYFETVLVHGDAMIPGHLRIESDRSLNYPVKDQRNSSWRTSFVIPEDRPYLIFLKAGCMDGDKVPHHPRHYGMKVVAVG